MYGIQGHGLEGNALPDVTIAQMARRDLSTIRRVQPTGPYAIMGHSLGTLIVFEVARRLVEAGEAVTYLGLLDPPDPTAIERSSVLASLVQEHESEPVDHNVLARLRNEIADAYPFATRSFWRRVQSDGRFHAWFEAGGSAARRYQLKHPLALDNTYVYLAEGTPASVAEGWFTQPPHIVPVPGDHLSMLRRPYVTELAAAVSQHIAVPA